MCYATHLHTLAHTLTPPSSLQHGFYNTDQGRESFALNLKQITDGEFWVIPCVFLVPPHPSHPFSTAVHTTCYSDVLHSLLQANAYYKVRYLC